MSTLATVRSNIASVLNASNLYDDDIDVALELALRTIEENHTLPYMTARVDLITTDETTIGGAPVSANSRQFPVHKQSFDWRGGVQGQYINGIPIPPQIKRWESVKLLNEAGDEHIKDLVRIDYEDIKNIFTEGEPGYYWLDRVGPPTGGSALSPILRQWVGLWPKAETDNYTIRLDLRVFTDPFPQNDTDPHWMFRNGRLLLMSEAMVNHLAPLVRDAGLYTTYEKIREVQLRKFHHWSDEHDQTDKIERVGSSIWGP